MAPRKSREYALRYEAFFTVDSSLSNNSYFSNKEKKTDGIHSVLILSSRV
jgi:hypothetical protein